MQLTEDDVPGAKLKFPVVKDNNVADLKRWLACRNLPVGGRKIELIDRVEACISNNQSHIIFVGIDDGVWWRKKCDSNFDAQTNPGNGPTSFALPNVGWKAFPSVPIPRSFCFGIIQQYATTVNAVNNEDDVSTDPESTDTFVPVCGNSKSMRRGRISFSSGHIQNVQDNTNATHYFLKADVLSSYRQNVVYKVHVILDSESMVVDAACNCKASESKSCSHILGLLFMLEDFTLHFGFEPPTCTSKLKEWNKGRKRGNHPQNVLDAEYSKFDEQGMRKRIAVYEPTSIPAESEQSSQVTSNFLRQIQTLKQPTMWGYLLQFDYQDYTLDAEMKIVLEGKVSLALAYLSPSTNGPVEIGVEQGSQNWLNQRRLRISASDCKVYFTSKNLDNLVNKKLWIASVGIGHLPQIAYGKEHEEDARLEYEQVMNCKVRQVGMFINKLYPGLSCSPDGIIVKDGIDVGLVEIKCPYSLSQSSPFDRSNLKKLKNPFFTICNDNVKVKRNHAYYFQVQLSLAILEMQYCEFVIWTENNMIAVDRIYRDDTFIQYLTVKLMRVRKNILVEYFEMRLPRKLPLLLYYN